MKLGLRGLMGQLDSVLAASALVLMALIPLVEILVRPLAGSGIENASVIVQHLGLVMAMFGSVAALRHGHLSSFGKGFASATWPRLTTFSQRYGLLFAALVCGLLCMASWRLVDSERPVAHLLAYGIPVWWLQASMPLGFAWLGLQLGVQGMRPFATPAGLGAWPRQLGTVLSALPLLLGVWLAWQLDGTALTVWPAVIALVAGLLCGAPIFSVLGALALALFWQDGLPLASIALSHYQITVNPSLPALPLFTLAGLVFARTGAAKRLGAVFVALFGGGPTGTVVAAAVLCSAFTAFTGGSGVTILALGGLLLPLLRNAGFPEQRGISLVTSASALGVLLAPSVPLIMYAIIARVPINTMFLAGLLPACIMVVFLLVLGGYLRRLPAAYSATLDPATSPAEVAPRLAAQRPAVGAALWQAKWEILAPAVAIGALVSGLATPTESAAIAAAYAILTQVLAHHELGWKKLGTTLAECTQIIGGVMLILGMALGLTNFLIEAGIPDMAIEWVQGMVPNKWVFLLVLNVFLFLAGALMEIFAALVVLVPLLLPVAMSYGIDPVHFGIIFLANMELGFLCPPAGMNIYFASAMFNKPVRYVAVAVLPALLAIFLGTLAIALVPATATWLPNLLLGAAR
ncbi:C4-dicarboxylate ABC transporter permease [Rhodoferax lacus]|uniref:C4-dicarboxylate ABC transporter permease n=1 Tax=Rhodoferax lacus TaxID=2184758 RepID=A0A3E1RCM1_9BURK|nr:TRAP transporter large permease subunit [Rhodoferax lacus]RFO97114.1 C4-dicarboxylate ABC transporter permease [Rhodoferax lacus]